MALQSSWDNTTLFVDDDPADRAFRQEVRDWITQNLPVELCNRSTRIDPPELKPWHRKLYERGWIAPHWPKEHGGMGATLDPADHPVRGDQPGRRAHALSARPQFHRALDHRRRNARSRRRSTCRRSSPARSRGARAIRRRAPDPTSRASRPAPSSTARSSSSTATRCGPRTAISPTGCSRSCAPIPRRSRVTPASACC